jgi:phosphatidylglycerol:prolipoprotein diacylglycerol transferase
MHVTGGLSDLMERAEREILAVTYWFEPGPSPFPYPVTVRFTGHRAGVKGRFHLGDRFSHDESIEHVVPGSGPISISARIRDITPGRWIVSARRLEPVRYARERQGPGGAELATDRQSPLPRLWQRWAPSAELDRPVRTTLEAFARVPGILPGIWAIMVTLGMLVALATQTFVISLGHLKAGPAWQVTLVAIAAGILGAKLWCLLLHRHAHEIEHRMDGWCIQGFIVGASLTAVLVMALLSAPIGFFLDATASGLLFGMAIGRIGCFFAGCCGGQPTVARWGIWSSDQRVGVRRIPTQLIESALAFGLGLAALVEVLSHGAAGGAFFVSGLAAYTLGRQGILRLRAEPRKTRLGGWVTGAAATLVLAIGLAVLAQCHLQPTVA